MCCPKCGYNQCNDNCKIRYQNDHLTYLTIDAGAPTAIICFIFGLLIGVLITLAVVEL